MAQREIYLGPNFKGDKKPAQTPVVGVYDAGKQAAAFGVPLDQTVPDTAPASLSKEEWAKIRAGQA